MLRLFFFSLFGLLVFHSTAQVQFTNAAQTILGGQDIRSTVGIGIDDINGDRKDDLVLLDQGQFLKTFIQTTENTSFVAQDHIQISNFGAWSMITGDLDNDGVTEIITSTNENGSTVLFEQNGTYTPRQFTTQVYSQNTNLVDLNNDGFLDLFVCNDDGESLTFLNNGDGQMVAEKLIDFQTSPEDDMSGNYSSIFTDIDNDGDQDLYIAKCRAGVTEETDRRRINTLYINDGQGNYSEQAEEFGLAIGAQSWSTDAGDIDNDGDIDLIIANHYSPHDLMINNGDGTFTRFEGLPESAISFGYQSFFEDFDNNGWLDIFITEPSKSYILYNEGMCFTNHPLSVGGKKAFSGATGDFNSDGFPDLYLGFAPSFQSPSTSTNDAVMLNDGNHLNWLDITLEGSESNTDGIGSRITIYLGDELKTREIRAGQSYGIMNSTVAHFGLGSHEAIDSIVVSWPSGNETHITSPTLPNNQITISESGCKTERIALPDLQLCNDGPISVSLEEEYDTYLWSDGSIEPILSTLEPGIFSVIVTKDGCTIESNNFTVTEDFDYQPEDIISSVSLTGCRDEVLQLSAPSAVSYLWSDGSTERTVDLINASVYQVTVSTNCNSYISEELVIPWSSEVEPEIMEDSVEIGQVANLSLTGEEVSWYKTQKDIEFIGTGNNYQTVPLFRDTSYYAQSRRVGYSITQDLMTSIPFNGDEAQTYPINDTLPFTVNHQTLLRSFSVRTQVAGSRQIEIWKNGQLYWSKMMNFEEGVNKINFLDVLEEGEYLLTTNSDVNMENLGVEVPLFSYSDLYSHADKNIPGHFYIRESELYPGKTPYFFDWQIQTRYFDCAFRYEVNAFIKDPVNTDEYTITSKVYPNPTNDYIVIESEIDYPAQMKIIDMKGKVMKSRIIRTDKTIVDLDFPSGIYSLSLKSGNQVANSIITVIND